MKKHDALIRENPIIFTPDCACIIGVNCAILAQKLQFLISSPDCGKEIEGEKWIYNTYDQWQEKYFSFWSTDTIERGFVQLEKLGIVATIQPEGRGSRRKYYRITEAGMVTLNAKHIPDDRNLRCVDHDRNLRCSDDRKLRCSCAGASVYAENTTENTETLSLSNDFAFNPSAEKKKKNRGKEKETIEFPASLDTPDFRTAWTEYLAFRRENKFREPQPMSVSKQFRAMEKWGVVAAISAIENTIRNNYQGIFEPKANGNGQPREPEIDLSRIRHKTPPRNILTDPS